MSFLSWMMYITNNQGQKVNSQQWKPVWTEHECEAETVVWRICCMFTYKIHDGYEINEEEYHNIEIIQLV